MCLVSKGRRECWLDGSEVEGAPKSWSVPIDKKFWWGSRVLVGRRKGSLLSKNGLENFNAHFEQPSCNMHSITGKLNISEGFGEVAIFLRLVLNSAEIGTVWTAIGGGSHPCKMVGWRR